MRRDWRQFVFWFGVLAAGAAAWISWWALSGFQVPICQDASAVNCLSYDDTRAGMFESSRLASRVAAGANDWAALIIAVFAAIVAIFTVRLWRSTERLLTITSRTLQHAEQKSRRELRAYVSVEPLGIAEYPGHNCLVGRFQVRNIGKLPARDVSVYSTIGLDADATRRDFTVGTPRISPTVLQPGAAMELLSYEGYPIPADQIDRDEPLKLAGYLYVWGEVLYTDELNTVGWTAFCHRYPCDMFGVGEEGAAASRRRNRSIDRKFARCHEEAGNEAG